jgi:glycosyltransferase involved in cell wall biosynthesis
MHDATVFSEHDPRSTVAKARLKMMIHLAASSADIIITDSDFSASQLEHFVPSARGKITRIWAGVSNTFLETTDEVVCKQTLEKVPLDKGFVLYYGGYRKYKNVHLLLRAYAQVASKFPHQLVLVGSANSLDDTYSALIHELGLEDRVTLFGFATDVELKVLLANCAVFVFPSATEGFGLPVVEAMACGAPVVCSTGGSLPEIAGDAALYVNDLTADALANAIQRVLTNEDLRRQLLKAGILRSRQFRWSETTRQLIDVYREVAQKRKFRS